MFIINPLAKSPKVTTCVGLGVTIALPLTTIVPKLILVEVSGSITVTLLSGTFPSLYTVIV